MPDIPVFRVKQHTRIENALRINPPFGGSEHLHKQRVGFTLVTAAVIAPNRVMVRDGAATGDHGFIRSLLDVAPGGQGAVDRTICRARAQSEVRRGAVRVQVGQAAG